MTPPTSAFPVAIEIRVAWGEMDAFRHVNNIVYFRYFESARIAYFERIGYTERMAATGVGPILAETRCRYRIPLTYPDTVEVGARVTAVGEDRFRMAYTVFSRRHRKTAAEGDGLVVSFDYGAGRKTVLPKTLVDRIRELEPDPPATL